MNNLSYYKLFFKAITNSTRLNIINLLKNDSKSVTEICEDLDFEQSRVSHALTCLNDCGFLTSEWKNGLKYYSLEKELIVPIINILDQHIQKNEFKLSNCKIIKNQGKISNLNKIEREIKIINKIEG